MASAACRSVIEKSAASASGSLDARQARDAERRDRVAEQGAVLGEVRDHADPVVHVEGRDGREVGRREAAPDEIRGGAARALEAGQVGERLVEEQQEAPARGRGDAQLVGLVRVGRVDVAERDDLGGPAVLLDLEVGGGQPPHRLAVLVDHEDRHQHHRHVGAEHGRRLRPRLVLRGQRCHEGEYERTGRDADDASSRTSPGGDECAHRITGPLRQVKTDPAYVGRSRARPSTANSLDVLVDPVRNFESSPSGWIKRLMSGPVYHLGNPMIDKRLRNIHGVQLVGIQVADSLTKLLSPSGVLAGPGFRAW